MSKKNKKEKPKKNRGKVVKKVLAIILIVIIAFAAVTTCITAVGLAANGKKVKSFSRHFSTPYIYVYSSFSILKS